MSTSVLAIDPGNEKSAFVVWSGERVIRYGKVHNEALLRDLERVGRDAGMLGGLDIQDVAIEMVASYGMPVGAEVFDTVFWAGRFVQAWGGDFTRVYRREVKLHLCGDSRAKDGNIRAALIDRFGPGRDKAVGTKADPGPLHGIKADVWQALAVALTYAETKGADHAAA